MDVVSVGATINVMMAAAMADGMTVIGLVAAIALLDVYKRQPVTPQISR